MSSRRGFLKQALTVMAGATVVTPQLIRAVEHVQQYHPEVQSVLNRIGGTILSHERQAIIRFVLAEIENGNWELTDALYIHIEPFLGINLRGDGSN